MYRKAAVIYNPKAGQLNGNGRHLVDRAAEALLDLAADVVVVATEGPRLAGAMARYEIDSGADVIFAVGGDGTISEVADGMALSHVPLGILPAGTANVLAHEIRVPRNAIAAAQHSSRYVPKRVSLGFAQMDSGDSRHFLLMAGAGFDAAVIHGLTPEFKKRLGKLSYVLGGLSRMGTELTELDTIVDGGSNRCSFALVSRVKNYGGDFEIARNISLNDQCFEVVCFEGRNSWRYLRYLVGVATRTLPQTRGVTSVHTGQVRLSPVDSTVHLQVDGELAGLLPATIRIVPDALTLLVPAHKTS